MQCPSRCPAFSTSTAASHHLIPRPPPLGSWSRGSFPSDKSLSTFTRFPPSHLATHRQTNSLDLEDGKQGSSVIPPEGWLPVSRSRQRMAVCWWQVVMDERDYQDSAAEISLTLAASHVKGVWEERLPLALHTALVVGCVTALLPRARGRPLTEGFSLSDLQASSNGLLPCHWSSLSNPYEGNRNLPFTGFQDKSELQ